MLNTYQAILRGEVLEWLADKPKNLTPERAVSVYVTILEDAPSWGAERGQKMADALEKLTQMETTIAARDPLQWERETRQDRPLPDREDDAD